MRLLQPYRLVRDHQQEPARIIVPGLSVRSSRGYDVRARGRPCGTAAAESNRRFAS